MTAWALSRRLEAWVRRRPGLHGGPWTPGLHCGAGGGGARIPVLPLPPIVTATYLVNVAVCGGDIFDFDLKWFI